jgi:hypothetical protein
MDLLATLAALKNKRTPPPASVPESSPKEKEETLDADLVFLEELVFPSPKKRPDDFIPYTSQTGYTEPNRDLFVAIHSPYLRDPYSLSDMMAFRAYRKWALAPSLYVLNTFSRFDTDLLLHLYLKHYPPPDTLSVYRLWQVLSEIQLTVPGNYEVEFLAEARKGIEERKISP